MNTPVTGLLLSVLLLLTLRLQELVDGCSCYPRHPQLIWCHSDIGNWTAPSGDCTCTVKCGDLEVAVQDALPLQKLCYTGSSLSDSPFKYIAWREVAVLTRYINETRQKKLGLVHSSMYKGFEKMKMVEYLHTSSTSSTCGVELEHNIQYLITGKVDMEGDVHIGLCDWIVPWADLTSVQKRYLKGKKYETGCSCQIITCLRLPCSTPAANQCIWTDMATEKTGAGSQAKNSFCKKRAGSCHWR